MVNIKINKTCNATKDKYPKLMISDDKKTIIYCIDEINEYKIYGVALFSDKYSFGEHIIELYKHGFIDFDGEIILKNEV